MVQPASLEAAQRKPLSNQTSSSGGKVSETFYLQHLYGVILVFIYLQVRGESAWDVAQTTSFVNLEGCREHSLCSVVPLTSALLHTLFCNFF